MARQINKIGEFTDLLDTDLLANTFLPAALPDFSSPSSFSLPPDMTASASGIRVRKISFIYFAFGQSLNRKEKRG